MREIVLVRHGETDWNREKRMQGHADISLNERGRAQAAAVAQRFSGQSFDEIWSSDLSRARETAAAIGATVGVTPTLSDCWRELDVGDAEGMIGFTFGGRTRELLKMPQGLAEPVLPGGESLLAFRDRIRRGWAAVQSERALVVSHGGTIKALLVDLLGLDVTRIDSLSMRVNTGVSIVQMHEERPRITLLNCGAHLDAV